MLFTWPRGSWMGVGGSLRGPVSSGELLNAANHDLVAGSSGPGECDSAWSSRLRKNRVKRPRSLPQTCGEERQKPAGSAPVDATRRAADGPSPFHRSSRGLGQVADADQVVHRQAEDEHPAHATSAAVAGLA